MKHLEIGKYITITFPIQRYLIFFFFKFHICLFISSWLIYASQEVQLEIDKISQNWLSTRYLFFSRKYIVLFVLFVLITIYISGSLVNYSHKDTLQCQLCRGRSMNIILPLIKLVTVNDNYLQLIKTFTVNRIIIYLSL